MMPRVYLMDLQRTIGWPKHAYKIGITSFDDPMERIQQNSKREIEEDTIIVNFPKIKCIYSIKTDTMDQAEYFETQLINLVKKRFSQNNYVRDKIHFFHNWHEKRQLSGITEMRKWNPVEVDYVLKLMQDIEKELALRQK